MAQQIVTGTVTVTNGSPTVQGDSSCDFSTVIVGQSLFKLQGAGPGAIYTITAVNVGAATLTLNQPYTGISETLADFIVHGAFTPNRQFPIVRGGDVDGEIFLTYGFKLLDTILGPP